MEVFLDNDVIVVGAGPAGLMAAIVAADRGRRVLLLEKMDQAGRKLRITGKGRCNLTNTAQVKDFLGHVGPDSRFLRNVFAQFFNTELMQFFEQCGVPLVEERGGRVFPQSGRSLDIFLALINRVERSPRISFVKNARVDRLLVSDGAVKGVRLLDGREALAPRVVVATGGLSYPSTGSTGDGFRWAEEAGILTSPRFPSLVPLVCVEPIPSALQDFTLKNVNLSITMPNGKRICDFFGELCFTADGIGGPLTLSASRCVSRMIAQGDQLMAHIDLKPAVEREVLDRRLISDLNGNGNRLLHDALRMWMPGELIPLFFMRHPLERCKRLHQLNGAERRTLLNFLKDVPFHLCGTRGFEEAIVTQGGVCLGEMNPKTMESKKVKGLFFAGEVLDLDADTGGYNLQIAFSTGYAAGWNC